MTADEILQRFPNASADFVRANADQPREVGVRTGDTRPATELERHSGDGAVGAVRVQKAIAGRVRVVVTSYRTRLLDEDNLCEKYVVDCCRYAGVLAADSPGQTKIEVRQEKVGKGEPEFTRVQIFT